MSYQEKDLFDYMDSGRIVRVIDVDGRKYDGRCWAYSAAVSKEEFGITEPCLDIGCSTVLALSEIKNIEFVRDK